MGEFYYHKLGSGFDPNSTEQPDAIAEYIATNNLISLDASKAIIAFNMWRKKQNLAPVNGFIFGSQHPRLITEFLKHIICTLECKEYPLGKFVRWHSANSFDAMFQQTIRYRADIVDRCSDLIKASFVSGLNLSNTLDGIYFIPNEGITIPNFEFTTFDILTLYSCVKKGMPIERLNIKKLDFVHRNIHNPKYKEQVKQAVLNLI